jgi:uncharacterized protein YabE (DUF348 family)
VGIRVAAADLSVSRGAPIGRDGLDLDVVTPKKLTVRLAGDKPTKKNVTALTVGQALDELGVDVDKHDEVRPGLGAALDDGDRVVFTNVRKVTKKVTEAVSHDTVERTDSAMFEDESETVREGRDGTRRVVYKITLENGKVARTKRFQPNREFEESDLPAVRAPQEGVICLRRLAAIAAALG